MTSLDTIKNLNIIKGDFVELESGKLIQVDFLSQTGQVYGSDVDGYEVSTRGNKIVKNWKQ